MKPPHFFEEEAWYFVTTTVEGRSPHFLRSKNARLCLMAIRAACTMTDAKIAAYVVMPDHIHLLVSCSGLPRFMKLLKGRGAKEINASLGRKGRSLWQPGYWETGIRDERMFRQKINYIHLNPVKAGLVRLPEEYPHSSAGHYMKKCGYCLFD